MMNSLCREKERGILINVRVKMAKNKMYEKVRTNNDLEKV